MRPVRFSAAPYRAAAR